MFDPKAFEDISQKIGALIAASPAKDVEKNVRALLSSFFARLDLVTREEFDVQAEVLARTRAKLAELETRLAALEKAARDRDAA
jgi:BMFP domain-containing protein YqiC